MHGIGGVAGADDNFPGVDLDTLAATDQFRSVMFGSEDLGKPVAQGGLFTFQDLMLRDDLVLAPLQRVV
jgi:hypothetical protein